MEALKVYLKEIRSIPLLSAQQEIELSKKIKRGDEQARKEMIRANLRLVVNIAKRYMHLGVPFLDLIEEGNLGLMKAVDKFNHRKGYRFSTYSAWWIRQAIMRYISERGRLIRVPVYMHEIIAKWKKAAERISHRLKRQPTDQEIARKLRISSEKMGQINLWFSATTSSLETPIGEGEESKIADLVESQTAVAPDAEITRFLDKERLNKMLEIMSDRERQVLDMRFGLEDGKSHTLAEVAKKAGVSRERVRQIEEKALKKLRKFVQQ